MAKDETASKRLAEKIARDRARYTLSLLGAFKDFVLDLDHAYGQPARDAADTETVVLSAAEEAQVQAKRAAEQRSQHVLGQLAVARFLKRMGPDYLAPFADQFANLAQAFNDKNNGIPTPIFDLASAKRRSDPTEVWLARVYVALAVEAKRQCGYDRDSAAEWAAKKYPELEQLITQNAIHRDKGGLKKTIISWCEDFSSHKIRNEVAAGVYDKLKAGMLNCDSDQMETEADRLLQEAIRLLEGFGGFNSDEIKVGIFPPSYPDRIHKKIVVHRPSL